QNHGRVWVLLDRKGKRGLRSFRGGGSAPRCGYPPGVAVDSTAGRNLSKKSARKFGFGSPGSWTRAKAYPKTDRKAPDVVRGGSRARRLTYFPGLLYFGANRLRDVTYVVFLRRPTARERIGTLRSGPRRSGPRRSGTRR